MLESRHLNQKLMKEGEAVLQLFLSFKSRHFICMVNAIKKRQTGKQKFEEFFF